MGIIERIKAIYFNFFNKQKLLDTANNDEAKEIDESVASAIQAPNIKKEKSIFEEAGDRKKIMELQKQYMMRIYFRRRYDRRTN